VLNTENHPKKTKTITGREVSVRRKPKLKENGRRLSLYRKEMKANTGKESPVAITVGGVPGTKAALLIR